MKYHFLIFVLFLKYTSFGQAFLTIPISGTEGQDWIIVNYVDWDTVGFKDHNCGSKSYDGHQGTDFTIRSFRQMDSGVNVLAAADGIITYVNDGEFDRETDGTLSKKLGNYIAIKHPNNYYSYYGHLRKNSIPVKVGETVTQGQTIGQVGSSGNSTDPHLHFELWYDSMYVVDPFKGDCGNKESLWLNEPTYDSTSGHFESGIDLRSNIDINILRERSFQNTQPYVILPSSDSSLYFWSHLYGLRKGKNLLLEWKEPNNQLWFKYDTKLDKDYWYYYYWSYITHENLKEGPWNVQLSYNGSLISRVEFNVSEKANLVTTKPFDLCTRAKNQSSAQLENSPNVKLNIYNIFGHEMDQTQIIPPGLYVYHLTKERQTCTFKRIHR